MRVLRTRIILAVLSLLALGLAGAGSAAAQASSTANQSVTFTVQAINQISISGGAVSLTITTATAGNAPDSVTNSATTWAVTTNQDDTKVSAQIDGATAMPTGVTLLLAMAAPTGATSTRQSLDLTSKDLITNIDRKNESGLALTYTLKATSAAGVVNSSNTRTIVFTVTGGV